MRRMGSDRGVALIIALVVTAFLVLLSVELSTVANIDVEAAAFYRDEVRAHYLARGGVELAVSSLLRDRTPFTSYSEEWARLPEEIRVGEGILRVKLRDEGGKLNLNRILEDEEAQRVLERLFFLLELDPRLVGGLLDWMDADDLERGPGTEGAYYRELRSPYPVKNAPLDTLSELRDIKGFDDKVLAKLGSQKMFGSLDLQTIPFLTLHSDGRVNINTAPPLLLRALSENLTEEVAESIVQSREERPLEKVEELKEVPGVTEELFSEIKGLVTVESNYFSLSASAEMNGVRTHLFAILKKEEGRVSVIYWRSL